MFNYKVCNISESYFCNFQESWFWHWLIHLLTMESINVALINFKIFSCRMNNHKSHCFQYLFHTKVSSNSDVYIIWRVCQHIFFYFCGYFLYKPACCLLIFWPVFDWFVNRYTNAAVLVACASELSSLTHFAGT